MAILKGQQFDLEIKHRGHNAHMQYEYTFNFLINGVEMLNPALINPEFYDGGHVFDLENSNYFLGAFLKKILSEKKGSYIGKDEFIESRIKIDTFYDYKKAIEEKFENKSLFVKNADDEITHGSYLDFLETLVYPGRVNIIEVEMWFDYRRFINKKDGLKMDLITESTLEDLQVFIDELDSEFKAVSDRYYENKALYYEDYLWDENRNFPGEGL